MEKEYDSQISCQNKYGEWVPAIPLPFYYPRSLFWWTFVCCAKTEKGACNKGFKTEEEYRGHYALVHVMGL